MAGSSLEARLARYLAVARALGASPPFSEDDLSEFRRQAAAAFPRYFRRLALIATPDGQEIMNLRVLPSLAAPEPARLRRPNPRIRAGHPNRERSLPGQEHRQLASNHQSIFRDGKPYRSLTIGMSAEGFFRLLDAQRLPEGWIRHERTATGAMSPALPETLPNPVSRSPKAGKRPFNARALQNSLR